MAKEKIEDIGENIPKPSWINKSFKKTFKNGEYTGKLPVVNLSRLEKMGVPKNTAFSVSFIRQMAMKRVKYFYDKNKFNDSLASKEKAHDLIVNLLEKDKDGSLSSDFLLEMENYISESQSNVLRKDIVPFHLIEKTPYDSLDLLASSTITKGAFVNGDSLIKMKIGRKIGKFKVNIEEDVDSFLLEKIGEENTKRKAPKEKQGGDFRYYPPLYIKENKSGGIDVLIKNAPKKFLSIMSFDSHKDARSYLYKRGEDGELENIEEFFSAVEKAKAPSLFRKGISAPRTGKEYRNGEDISPEMFHKIFPFRAIQFGSYVENDLRQKNLNEAFDALNDMALSLGVNRKLLLSPTGRRTMSLAFGARGRGGKRGLSCLAHFESSHFIVNLAKRTKSNAGGAGSLCHEMMGHGLDAELGIIVGGDEEHSGNLSSYHPRGKKRIEFPAGYPDSVSLQKAIISFGEIMETINSSDMIKASIEEDKKMTKDYFSLPHELFARAVEGFTKHQLEKEHGIRNDFLVSFCEESALYPSKKDLELLSPNFKQMFSALSEYRVEIGLDKKEEVGFSKPEIPVKKELGNVQENDVLDEFETTPIKKPSKKRKPKQRSLF